MTKEILLHEGKLAVSGHKKILPAKHSKESIQKKQKPVDLEISIFKDLKVALDGTSSLCALPAHVLKNNL